MTPDAPTRLLKHATASAFVFHHDRAEGWRTGLVLHPVFARWMMPGGHVEDYENTEEAVLREVAEETGLTGIRLWSPAGPPAVVGGGVDPAAAVEVPCWISEHVIPDGDNQLSERHIHIDHKYVAITENPNSVTEPAHPFRWWKRAELADLSMFDDVRENALTLFELLASGDPIADRE
ncbi:NUDIX domain-containing protein [Stackebrandtia albiflava]|uniref:NUDIX domain-containing protein n=1 Tax=Stackebrandtia albiflava TaxID=406432 RepID=A0A562VGT4_9ACTN|nr:NUDIX domain-containing protein [Stackebrandtia albiflava]TWJ17109.1 NUDIX domain-containing protein [Stackebrandtia albiflava]